MFKKNNEKAVILFVLTSIILSTSACSTSKSNNIDYKKITANVTSIKKYGHAILDVTVSDLEEAGYVFGDVLYIETESFKGEMPYFDGYYTDSGDLLLHGKTQGGELTICINYGDFCKKYGVKVGDIIEITMEGKAGKLLMQETCALRYTNDRSHYADDSTFANYRSITSGRIGNKKLFRSSSPTNNEINRAEYTSELIESDGICTILNLSDSELVVNELFENENIDSDFYRNLYDSGQVMLLDLAINYHSKDFAAAVAKGITFLSQKEPPYLLHCKEGKDRSGFVAMIISALMGASVDEVVNDYMISFYNYYGITKDNHPEKYHFILENNLLEMMLHVTDVKVISELKKINLEDAITTYLLEAGMSQKNIDKLKEKLK